MHFVRCNSVHHCIAYARTGTSSLNHIAFEVQGIDSVMRGIGRMRDAGFAPVWGPGRHGPGNNVFGYFIGPHGGVIEYTAEVQRVGEDYKVGKPEDWGWPPGRTDQWGGSTATTSASPPPSATTPGDNYGRCPEVRCAWRAKSIVRENKNG